MNWKKGLCQGNLRADLEPREALERAASRGFHGIELRLDSEARVGLPSPYDEPDRAAELVRSAGMEVPSTMGPTFLDLFPLPLEQSLPRIVARTERGLQAARAMGATAILQIPGYVQLGWDAKLAPISYDAAYEKALTIYRELRVLAERYRVQICVENVWNRFLLSPLEFARFVDEIDSPWVTAYFDVGNVVVGGFPEQWIRILGRRTGRVHLKDYRRSVGTLGGFVMLLEGDVDWRAVVDALVAIGYQGYLTAEYGPYAHAPDVLLDHLRASMDAIIAMAG